MKKKLLIAGSAIAGLLVISILGLVLFLDANQFRPQLEQTMAEALGRTVTIGHIKGALLSGGVAVEDLSIADDPAFSGAPFVTAKAVTVGVNLMPLILSRSLRVQTIRLEDPQVVLLRSASGRWNFSSLVGASSAAASDGSKAAMSLSVRKITIASGRIIVGTAGAGGKERLYDNVNLEVSNLSLTSEFPFRMTANTPGGGTLTLDGQAGPINLSDAANTPFQATTEIAHLDMKSTGFIDPASGLSGVVDFRGSLASDGQRLTSKGKLHAAGVQLVPGGMPARVPMEIDYQSDASRETQTGVVKGDVHIGAAVAHLTGDYNAAGEAIAVRMKLTGERMPAPDLEAALPAIGVKLPFGASLKQGTMDVNLTVNGPVDRLVIAGPVDVSNVLVAGFDLGGKLGALPSLAGLSGAPKSGDTLVQTLAATLRVAPGGIQVASLDVVAPAIGSLTGSGTISPKDDVDFAMRAKLTGSGVVGEVSRVVSLAQPAGGIPFHIRGTTTNPVFVPDVGGTVGGAVSGVVASPDAAAKAAGALGGLLGVAKR
jgi:AsmA protein